MSSLLNPGILPGSNSPYVHDAISAVLRRPPEKHKTNQNKIKVSVDPRQMQKKKQEQKGTIIKDLLFCHVVGSSLVYVLSVL